MSRRAPPPLVHIAHYPDQLEPAYGTSVEIRAACGDIGRENKDGDLLDTQVGRKVKDLKPPPFYFVWSDDAPRATCEMCRREMVKRVPSVLNVESN